MSATVSMPDDENILREILLRLPPLPSSLPRASLVCKLWRRIVSDAEFQRRFCGTHHKTPPPLLGFFFTDFDSGFRHVFVPTLGPPDRIPSARFLPEDNSNGAFSFVGCRHGLALLQKKFQALVWDPVANSQCCIDFPPEFKINHNLRVYDGAVLKDSPGSSAFKLVMVVYGIFERTAYACVYESQSGKWGDVISASVFSDCFAPSVLVGNKLYWLSRHIGRRGFLRFDMDDQRLVGIQMSNDIPLTDGSDVQALRTEDGGLGFAVLSKYTMQLWGRTVISGNVVTAVLQRTVELDQLLSLTPSMEVKKTSIVGYDEDNNTIFVWTAVGIFMIQLASMKFAKVLEETNGIQRYFPFTGFFYTVGNI